MTAPLIAVRDDWLVVTPGGPLTGAGQPGGDKSISHRVLIIAARARGETEVLNLSPAADVAATRSCLAALGVVMEDLASAGLEPGRAGSVMVRGAGPEPLAGPPVALDCRRSGTTMRLLAGLLAGGEREFTLTGDRQLLARPMDRVVSPLVGLGADIHATAGHGPVHGRGRPLAGGQIALDVASAQLGSAVLLAGLGASAPVTVIYPSPVRDHTERLLKAYGARLEWSATESRLEAPVPTLVPPMTADGTARLSLPGDLSSGANLLAAAAAVPGSAVTIAGAGLNPGRTGILDIMAAMGVGVAIRPDDGATWEPTGTVTASYASLEGVTVEGALIPRTVDELPLVAVLGALAKGRTVVRGALELRVKESDRIAAMVAGLARLGAAVTELPDGFEVRGPATLRGCELDGHGDHRVVMALAVAALAATGVSHIRGARTVADSFPGFADAVNALAQPRVQAA